MIRFSFQKTTVAALCRMDCRGPGVGGRPGRGTTVVNTRDNSASGDNGSEDGERCKILEDT